MSDNDQIAEFRKYLAELNAVLLTQSTIPGTNTVRLTRRWSEVWEAPKTARYASLLAIYASAKYDTEQRWVQDPVIGGGKTIAGKFLCVRVDASDGKSGDLPQGVIQTLQAVTDVSGIADLAAADHLDSQDEDVLRQFGMRPGRQKGRVMAWYCLMPDDATQTLCMETLTPEDITTALVPTGGWKFAGRKWDMQADGTVVFTVNFRQVSWRRWTPSTPWATGTDYEVGEQVTNGGSGYDATVDHDSGANFASDLAAGKWRLTHDPDTTDKSNEGRKTEGRRKTWTGFDQADIATIRAYLGVDANLDPLVDSGFHVAEVQTQASDDGSVSFVQALIPQWSEVAGLGATGNLGGSVKEEPHGQRPGTRDTFRSIYTGFTAAGLLAAVASEEAPTGYVLVALKPDIEASGLYTREYAYEKVTWMAWATATVTQTENPASDRPGTVREWQNVRIGDLATATADCINGTEKAAAIDGYTIKDVTIRDNHNGSFDITQHLVKRFNALTEASNGIAVNTTTPTEQIQPHSFQPGTLARCTIRYTDFLRTALPAGLAVGAAQGDGFVVSNVPEVQGDGYWSRTVVVETVVRRTWNAATIAAPDQTIPDPATSDRAGETRVWHGIRLADANTAATDCANGGSGPGANVSVPATHVVASVRVSPSGPGAVTVEMKIDKMVNGRTLQGKRILNPNGLFTGTLTRTMTVFEDFPYASLPDGGVVGTNGVVSNEAYGPHQNGLYSRVVIAEVLAWTKTWNDRMTLVESNAGGWALEQHLVAGGIASGDVANSAFAAAASTDVSNMAVVQRQLTEADNGERIVRQTLAVAKASTAPLPDPTVIRYLDPTEGRVKYRERVWYHVNTAVKDALTADGGKARVDATIGTVPCQHRECTVVDHGNGIFDVHQTLTGSTETMSAGIFWTTSYDTEQMFTRSSNDQVKIVAYTKYHFMCSSHWAAVNAIKTQAGTGTAVYDSDRVWKDGSGLYAAHVTVRKPKAKQPNINWADFV